MRMLAKTVLVAAVMAVGAIGAHAPAKADSFSFGFNTGDVAFAYRDGWWDHDHRWHRWHGRELREYRSRYGDHYNDWRHDRDRSMGWRDDDHDGVPNRADRAPENPYRR